MNGLIKKLSVRQVASFASLTILALALPIGLYLTDLTQNIHPQATVTKDACSVDSDCGCGIDSETGICAVENTAYLSGVCTMPDYCSGISGDLVPTCVNSQCSLVDPNQPTPTPSPSPSPTPSPSPSPTPTIFSPYDINQDGEINITDYTLFISGFISSLNQ